MGDAAAARIIMTVLYSVEVHGLVEPRSQHQFTASYPWGWRMWLCRTGPIAAGFCLSNIALARPCEHTSEVSVFNAGGVGHFVSLPMMKLIERKSVWKKDAMPLRRVCVLIPSVLRYVRCTKQEKSGTRMLAGLTECSTRDLKHLPVSCKPDQNSHGKNMTNP